MLFYHITLYDIYYAIDPIGWGHNASMAVVCLSVLFCLSVCPVPDPKSKMEGHRKLKIGRKEAHDMSDL